jgi:hypothetical protein
VPGPGWERFGRAPAVGTDAGQRASA